MGFNNNYKIDIKKRKKYIDMRDDLEIIQELRDLNTLELNKITECTNTSDIICLDE
jgi:hypothetical protein